ncbi:MAG: (Fe-S)-binding protein [Promethearchaeota archaeon]|nr:MAG: (Fe-S)-binding protein [Candidatus Lokiarchaeota archaeon]
MKHCYQCGRCSGVCQLSKVQKYTPSKIIQLILEGFEEKVLNSGVLWDCLTCNQCLKDCPEKINFADIVRIARYKMRHEANQNPEELIAHKGIYTTIAEIMSRPYIEPKRSLKWVPKGCKVTNKGDILYYVGCLPFYEYEFEDPLSIAQNALKIICQIEKKPIIVLEEETCCGHDIYWGQGKLKTFIKLAQKNLEKFEKTGATTIITACAECYRTFKIDYAKLFPNLSSKFQIKHLIEYVYDKWKQKEIQFKKPSKTSKDVEFTYHDPCRLSRFLPEEINLTDKVREIFAALTKLGYTFTEMKHNKSNSLCCGVNSWMNCNEKSKALRYKRMLEAKTAAPILVTSCPKCEIHFECLQNDFEDIAEIQILDFSEFIVDKIEMINPKTEGEKKK